MELQKIGIKFFVEEGSGVDLDEFIPIFHRWIQSKAVPDHLLIDVADYRHVHEGPGILLVAHEAILFLDQSDGKPGLLYLRKQPLDGGFGDRFAVLLKTTLDCCRRLEGEPELAGKVKFGGREFQILSNDRLLSPNTEDAASALKPALSQALDALYPGTAFHLAASPDGGERLAFTVGCDRDLIHAAS